MIERITEATETAFAERLTRAINTTEGAGKYHNLDDYNGLVEVINSAIDVSPQSLNFWGTDDKIRKELIVWYIKKFFSHITFPEKETDEVSIVPPQE